MSDDVTQKRKDRFEKLELLQELYFILHRNCLEVSDEMLKRAIVMKFHGKLELLIERDDRKQRRRDLTISVRLLRVDEAERPGGICFPVDHMTLVDMYERLKAVDEDVADGPKENVTVFDVAKGEERTT